MFSVVVVVVVVAVGNMFKFEFVTKDISVDDEFDNVVVELKLIISFGHAWYSKNMSKLK